MIRVKGPLPAPLLLDWSFLMALLGLHLILVARGMPWAEIGGFSITILMAVGTVLVHEYGHVVAARQLKVPVDSVRLRGLFGAAYIAPPESPKEEGLIALAGPAGNLLVAAILWMAGGAPHLSRIPHDLSQLEWAYLFNAGMGLINLLPALPLDGGRVLRALLTLPLGHETATRIGLGLGVLIALCALMVPFVIGPEPMTWASAVGGVVILLLQNRDRRIEEMRREEKRLMSRLDVATADQPASEN